MKEKTLEEKIYALRNSSIKIKDISGLGQSKRSSKEQLIKFALSQNENLNDHDLDKIAQALIHRNDFFIEINDKKISAEELRADVIETLEKPIKLLPNKFWFDQGKAVIKNMNDNEITLSDLSQRKDFFNNVIDRQDELYALLSLYQTNVLPNAKEIQTQIKNRILMLEQIKETVKKSTKEPEQAIENPKNTAVEQTKAKIYLGVLTFMEEEKHIPDVIKNKLELNNGVDFDYSISEQVHNNNLPETKNEIINRINELRGRQQQKSVVKSKSEKMRFDKDIYYYLEQQRELNQP